MREERTLRVFENRVLRRIFGHKMDEVTGGWRKHHNEDLHYVIIPVILIDRMKGPKEPPYQTSCNIVYVLVFAHTFK
jgi:hypothetical protein